MRFFRSTKNIDLHGFFLFLFRGYGEILRIFLPLYFSELTYDDFDFSFLFIN